MAIESTDLLRYKALVMNQTTSGGGRMSANPAPDNVIRDVIKDVSQAERVAGATLYYKVFVKNANAGNLTLIEPRIYMGYPPLGQCKLSVLSATFTDVIGDIGTPTRRYNCANITSLINVGGTTVVAESYGSSYNSFIVGDTVAILDAVDPDDLTGHIEFRTVSEVSYNGTAVTLTLSTGLDNAYTVTRTVNGATIKSRVAACLKPASGTKGSVSSLTKTSTSGTYDNTGVNAIVVDNIGGVTQVFTFTFSTATVFNVEGDTLGALGSGNRSSFFTPTNPSFSKPYLTVPSTFWTGTWAAGDTLVVITQPSAIPHWYEVIVPQNAEAISLENMDVWVTGHSGSA